MDREMVIRSAHAQFFEEHARHVVVEVLTSVDYDFLEPWPLRDRARYDARFDELRPRPKHRDDLHLMSLGPISVGTDAEVCQRLREPRRSFSNHHPTYSRLRFTLLLVERPRRAQAPS